MIRHIVLVKFRAGLAQADIDAVFVQLDALRAIVPGMLNFHAGANVSPEGLNRGFGHAFIADFADAVARDAYLEHPQHKAAGARLVSAAANGRDGILVLDLAC
ncbi:MAG: Dabb family protein [Methylobacteriaceae bacterium]|nr:Dabb family protein [Methylobacteriaceae bacterium]